MLVVSALALLGLIGFGGNYWYRHRGITFHGSGCAATSPQIAAAEDGVRLAAARLVFCFRIVGTPYFYEAPPALEKISVGRQRRKPGGLAEEGNDFVIRVPDSDEKSLRISRRHLEIQRVGNQCWVSDHSTAGTSLNGHRLIRQQSVALKSGDQLTLADVLTLEVLLRTDAVPGNVQSAIHVPSSAAGGPSLVIEATVGDMKTVEPETCTENSQK